MAYLNSWARFAACRNHRYLNPDDWHEVVDGLPVGNGMLALTVCLRSCPVVFECKEWMSKGRIPRETIAGGGWWDSKGKFHLGFDQRLMDTRQAAIFIGVQQKDIRNWTGRGLMIVSAKRSGKNYYAMDEVVRVQKERPVPHGTVESLHGHLARGELPCDLCEALAVTSDEKENYYADLL